MGHQGGKEKDVDKRLGLFETLEDLEHNVLKIPRADAVVFLYMPWDVAKELKKERGRYSDAHESNDAYMKNAEEAYLQLSEILKWTRIDCAPNGYPPRSIDDISIELSERVNPILSRK